MSSEDSNKDKIQSFHSMEGDLLASIKNPNYASNIVKIVTHDNKSQNDITPSILSSDDKPRFSFNINSKTLYIGLSIFFIILIAGGSYYFINSSIQSTKSTPLATTTIATSTPSPIVTHSGGIIQAEVMLPIQIAALNKPQLVDAINQAKQELLTRNVKNKINIALNTDVSLEDFLNKLQYSGSETLLRSFTPDQTYNLGLYHTQKDQFETYVLTKVDIFDLAFSGMLEWEKGMPIDLEKIYTYQVDTDTSSSTLATSSVSKVSPVFLDKVIKNIDVRIYTDPVKGVKIVYGIINKQYLLITSGENSFADIINKLLINNVLR